MERGKTENLSQMIPLERWNLVSETEVEIKMLLGDTSFRADNLWEINGSKNLNQPFPNNPHVVD